MGREGVGLQIRALVKLIVRSGGDAVNWTLKLTQLQISQSVEFLLVIGMGSNTSSPETAGGPGAGMQLAWGPVRHPRGQEERERVFQSSGQFIISLCSASSGLFCKRGPC